MDHKKPCPFCGSTYVIEYRIMQVASTNYFKVRCNTCQISGPVGSKEGRESAIEAWNHRVVEL